MSSSSLIRWLETSTVRPSAASERRKPRIQRMPSGSSPLTGSSNSSSGGSPSSAPAIPSRWRMPSEKPPTRRRATLSSPTSESTSGTRESGRPLLRACQRRWSRARRPGWTSPASSSDPDLAQRVLERRVRPAADERAARVRRVEPEDQPHRRRLAGAVGPDEPGHAARLDGEREPVDGERLAVALGQSLHFDHGGEGMRGPARLSSRPQSGLRNPPCGGRRPRRAAPQSARACRHRTARLAAHVRARPGA